MSSTLCSDTVRSMHPPGESIVAFKASITKEDEAFTGSLSSYDELSIWATERCIPLVREITFQVSLLQHKDWTRGSLEFALVCSPLAFIDKIKAHNLLCSVWCS